jgi:hypothetical protein
VANGTSRLLTITALAIVRLAKVDKTDLGFINVSFGATMVNAMVIVSCDLIVDIVISPY